MEASQRRCGIGHWELMAGDERCVMHSQCFFECLSPKGEGRDIPAQTEPADAAVSESGEMLADKLTALAHVEVDLAWSHGLTANVHEEQRRPCRGLEAIRRARNNDHSWIEHGRARRGT